MFSNELCIENILIELFDVYDLDMGSDCDYCCFCYGYFIYIVFYFDIESLFLKKFFNLVLVYSEVIFNCFIN